MKIYRKISLKQYSTMRLGGKAKFLTTVSNKKELINALDWANSQKLNTVVIGEGSNIIWQDKGFDGLVIVNKMEGFSFVDIDSKHALVNIGAGENWDEAVKNTVDAGYSGIEQLSLIPGTAGATPIQNVGAYGKEVSDCLKNVEVYDQKINKFASLDNSECGFGYRTSRFKTTDKGRFIVVSITLNLTKTNPKPPFYESLQNYLDNKDIKEYPASVIRDAVIAVRTSKLPDPDIVANNGSFFANPIVDKKLYLKLKKEYSDIVGWPLEHNKVKLSAAWLIDKIGFRGYHDKKTGIATWDKQPLVLINEHAKKTKDLIKFKEMLVGKIYDNFGVKLEQEPELI